MTTVYYVTPGGDEGNMQEVYKLADTEGPLIVERVSDEDTDVVGTDKFSPFKDVTPVGNIGSFPQNLFIEKEKKMISILEEQQYEILSVKSELITKRRYKRRMAKELKRRKARLG